MVLKDFKLLIFAWKIWGIAFSSWGGGGVGRRVVVPADTGTCDIKMVVFKSLVMKQKTWVRDDHELNLRLGKDSGTPAGQGLQKCPHSLANALQVTPKMKADTLSSTGAIDTKPPSTYCWDLGKGQWGGRSECLNWFPCAGQFCQLYWFGKVHFSVYLWYSLQTQSPRTPS